MTDGLAQKRLDVWANEDGGQLILTENDDGTLGVEIAYLDESRSCITIAAYRRPRIAKFVVDDGDLREAAQRVVDYWPDLPLPEYIGVGSIRERIEQLRAALARPALLTQTETEENDA